MTKKLIDYWIKEENGMITAIADEPYPDFEKAQIAEDDIPDLQATSGNAFTIKKGKLIKTGNVQEIIEKHLEKNIILQKLKQAEQQLLDILDQERINEALGVSLEIEDMGIMSIQKANTKTSSAATEAPVKGTLVSETIRLRELLQNQ